MIKENQKLLNRIQVLLDGMVIATAYILSWYLRFKSGFFVMHEWFLPLRVYMYLLVYILPGYLILYFVFHLYVPKRALGRRQEMLHIVQANLLGLMALILVLYVTHQSNISRTMLFIFFGANIFLEVVERNILRTILRRLRSRGYNQKHILLVGYSRAAEQYLDRVLANPEWGYHVRGILDDTHAIGTQYKGVRVIGTIENLHVILPENRLDEIVITLGIDQYQRLEKIVGICEKSGVHTKFIPDYHNIIPTKPYTEDIQGLPVINIRHVPLTNTFYRVTKRLVDLLGATVALILFSPIMLITAIAIKCTSPGPIIYKQERIGVKNIPFSMYKFRSMVVQSPTEEKKGWTTQNDARVTSVGKFIRRTSIDELPQLYNVLIGDMSLVGPRPERPQFVEQFKEEIPRYMIKHQVRPGMTGWAQVNGYRGDTSIRKRIEYDLYYIENWTLGFDLKILILTFVRGFVNKNAY